MASELPLFALRRENNYIGSPNGHMRQTQVNNSPILQSPLLASQTLQLQNLRQSQQSIQERQSPSLTTLSTLQRNLQNRSNMPSYSIEQDSQELMKTMIGIGGRGTPTMGRNTPVLNQSVSLKPPSSVTSPIGYGVNNQSLNLESEVQPSHGERPRRIRNQNSHMSNRSRHRSERARQGRDTSLLSSVVSVSSIDGRGQEPSLGTNQDDHWPDNTTAITGATSVASGSLEDLSKYGTGANVDPYGQMYLSQDLSSSCSFRLQKYLGTIIVVFMSLFAFFSPIVMILLPRFGVIRLRPDKAVCGAECDGLLISFSFKLFLLVVGTWAAFIRTPRATMPRIFLFRCVVLVLVFVFTFSYWLFFGVRVVEQPENLTYQGIVYFAMSLVDALLFIHYFAVILLELRHLQPQYYVHIVRSPDGVSKGYPIGQLSIQRAAAWLLDRYYADFPIYNPYLARLPTKNKGTKSNTTSFKFYDVDTPTGNGQVHSGQRTMSTTSRRKESSHNERFYEEYEYERRLKKRRARLFTAADEAFTHVKRFQDQDQGQGVTMDPLEAAQAIFPSLARPLQKYLRITRQQPRNTVESIIHHLATCLTHDLSARAFIEKFVETSPVLQNDREYVPVHTWSLICNVLLSRGIEDGTVFQLRQNEVSLLCCVSRLPHYNITEEVIDPKTNKFVLRLSSDTSV
ncbi:vang-like protein 2 isoform X1 [Artemia franciscana]